MNGQPDIWVVDDDTDDQYLISQALKAVSTRLTIKPISDGDELLPQLHQAAKLPKLVLLDLNMERMNGFEALRELRSCSPYKHLPVVVLTTSDAEEDRKKALQLGADAFFTKPIKFDGVVAMLRQLAIDWRLPK
ncbi:response regulator [uncultured Fibrella sp.]|uniref:response regulator n=1 Tax=uncultured Fibrella sp. TaxID=1284596 RepID=UPI0035CAD1D6